MKAGLLPDAWFDKDIRIYKFQGEIFSETSPYSKAEKRALPHTDHDDTP
jgi:AMMECR1 domain-containing protein